MFADQRLNLSNNRDTGMSEQAPKTIYLKDYTAPNFLVDTVVISSSRLNPRSTSAPSGSSAGSGTSGRGSPPRTKVPRPTSPDTSPRRAASALALREHPRPHLAAAVGLVP